MGTFTSTQGGYWHDNSTWTHGSAVPAAGDTVNIASGHIVRYTQAQSVGDGFGNVDIEGTLVHSELMHMNGQLLINGGGTLHQKSGSQILFKGDRNAIHGVWFENEANVTHVAEGSDGMPTTKLSGAHAVNSLYFSVDDASKFAAGEWFAVFNNHGPTIRNVDYHPIKKQDEGFWVTEVDTSTSPDRIYFRHFVGPDDSAIASSGGVTGSTITVTNGKVFRANQYITFGTSSVRNHCRVASINGNILTLKNTADEDDYSIVGDSTTLANKVVYRTGTVKPHGDDDRVRKCATIATVARADDDDTITVAQGEKFEAGDIILIEYPLEAGQVPAQERSIYNGSTPASYDAGFGGESVMHEVQSRANNVLTLEAEIGYVVPVGALVTRMTRDIVIGSQSSGADDIVASSNISYYYVEKVNNWSRHLILKDVWFKNIGSYKGSVYSGVVVRGRASTVGTGNGTDAEGNAWTANTYANPVYDDITIDYQRADREPYFEGLSIQCNPTETRSWGGFWSYDFRGANVRCSTSIQGLNGFAWYHEPNGKGFNNFAYCNTGNGFNWRGISEDAELGYCYSGRNNRGIFIEAVYNAGHVHDMINNVSTNDPMRLYRTNQRGFIWNIHCKDSYLKYPYLDSQVGQWTIMDSKFHGIDHYNTNNSPVTGTMRIGGSNYAGRQGYGPDGTILRILENDFEYDNVVNTTYYIAWRWDATEKAYLVIRSNHDDGEQAAVKEWVFVPANVTVTAKLTCKGVSGWSGTEPYAYVSSHIGKHGSDTDSTHSRTLGATYGTSREEGVWFLQQFADATFGSAYETIEYTVPALPYPRYIEVGVTAKDTDMGEGFYMKPIVVKLSDDYAHRDMNMANTTATIVKHYGVTGEQKRRFGGVS